MCKDGFLLYVCYMDILNNHHTFQLAIGLAVVFSFFAIVGAVVIIDSLTSNKSK